MLTAPELATLAREALASSFSCSATGATASCATFRTSSSASATVVSGSSSDRRILWRSPAPSACKPTRVTTAAAFGKAVRDGLAMNAPYLIEVDLASIGPMTRPYTGTSRPPTATTR